MSDHNKSIPGTTFAVIRKHLQDNEEPLDHPYLDNKGYVTIGTGFKIDNKEGFLKLDLVNKGRKATQAEKENAWAVLQAERSKDLTRGADKYAELTPLELSPEAHAAMLKGEIKSCYAKAEKVIGQDAWSKMSDGQKAVAIDIDYATGNVRRFSNFVAAAKRGDAAGMARESHFYSGEKQGGGKQRNWDRIARNHCLAAGLSGVACKQSVRDHYAKTGETVPDHVSYPGLVPPMQGQEKPKVNLDGGAGNDDLSSPKPNTAEDRKAKKLLDDFLKSGDAADEALLKPVTDRTEDENNAIMKKRIGLPSRDPMHKQLADAEKDFFKVNYGNAATKRDVTGRMAAPEAVRPVPQKPAPLKTPDGQSLDDALKGVTAQIGNNANKVGAGRAIKDFQTGLNIVGERLKVDGIAGPKTVRAARMATARLGAPKVKALDSLGGFTAKAQRGAFARQPDTLKQAMASLSAKPDAAKTLQSTLNKTGQDVLGGGFKALKEDGVIGPKTASAFTDVFKASGPMDFGRRIGDGFRLF